MPGLAIDEYRAIQTSAASESPIFTGKDLSGREVKTLVDPYYVRTMKQHGADISRYPYRYLFQCGLFPDIKYQIGTPNVSWLIARISIVINRCLTSLALGVMMLVGPSDKLEDYKAVRQMHDAIANGSLLHLRAIETEEFQDSRILSSIFNKCLLGHPESNWDTWLAHSNTITALAYKLGGTGVIHESIKEPDATTIDCNSSGLYVTINCLKSQANSIDWTRGTPIHALDQSEKAYEFFDRMEPLAVRLQETTQNLYDAFEAHTSTFRRMYKGTRADSELQLRIAEFQVSYQDAWAELVSSVKGI